MSAFRFADYATGETTLARDVWSEVPEDSLVIVDRNFPGRARAHSPREQRQSPLAVAGEDANALLGRRKARHRRRTGRRRSRPARSPPAVGGNASDPLPPQVKGHPRSTLLTSLTDPKLYPAKELVELYHERWEAEIAYDEVKTHLLAREEAIRSRTPDGVRQELWGIAIAYNLVRLEVERAAAEANVPPTRISFVAAVALVRE